MSTWSTSTEPYRDVPQNGLPHIGPGMLSTGGSATMTMMCGGVGLTWSARRSILAELRLGKPTLVSLYNAACRGQSGSA